MVEQLVDLRDVLMAYLKVYNWAAMKAGSLAHPMVAEMAA